jgi:bifunctional NMN adenylyltransferase/nudix hydrolase
MDISAGADAAVLIGRFQPFHCGHADLLHTALDSADKVVVVLGSSFHARNTRNPFSWQERAAMIAATLGEAERARVAFVAVRDYYDDTRWAAAVSRAVGGCTAGAAQVALVGWFKDASSYYLNHFPQWQLIATDFDSDIDATCVRRVLFEAENVEVSVSALANVVPLAVRQYLKAWTLLPHFPRLAEEHRQVSAYKAAWARAPYPPIFSTVDAVIVSGGHVLLIRRGGFPGKGQWAVPGGFVDQRERLLQAAIRELREETQLSVLGSTLEAALVDVKVFDHPDRSARGRTITHAHYFDLKSDHLPTVEAADDAAEVAWVPIAQVAGMEDQFFEDHFHMLDHFLGVSEPA